MGTQVIAGDSETNAESIVKYTRQPKKPPQYVPRSRSLGDLPGGLRVPIIKKPESRMQQKHEANIAGLEELKMLRQKHGQMVDDVRTLSSPQDTRRTTSQGRLSSSSLASIQEECSLQNDLQYQGTTNLPKARFSIASDDSFTDNASLCSSKSDTSKSNSASLESLKEGCDVVEPDTRTKEQIIEEFRNKFESTYGRQTSSFIQPRRRASIHVACLTSAPPPVDHSIRPKLRRASFQCEEVITKKSEREDPISKVISDFKLQYNFPSPLHAVTRQYGSASDITMREKVEPSPKSISKDLKSILSEWAVDKKSQQIKKPTVREQSKQISDSFNRKVIHDRNSSCTSDYFGSKDTLNTIHTLPTQETVNSERRQSLPIIFSTNESLSSLVPKIPERRKSLLDNSSLQSPANVDPKSPNLSLLDADDGICNEGNTDFHSNLLNNTKTVKTNDKSANNKSRKVPLETSL